MSSEFLPNAERVHRTITEMLMRGFSPRAVERHLNDSGLWATWPASERVSYTTIWRHGRQCMGWLQEMRQSILEKNLHNRGETIDSFVGSMADLLGGVEVAVQTNLNRLVADEFVPETLNEMINLMKFYVALRKELQALGQEGRYEAEMGAVGQAIAEIMGPKQVKLVSDRAKELLRNRKLALDTTSVVEAVEAEMRDAGMELT